MNAEMVSIQKVTGATDAEMQRLKDSAFEVAGNLGSTPSDYLASVTKWLRRDIRGFQTSWVSCPPRLRLSGT